MTSKGFLEALHTLSSHCTCGWDWFCPVINLSVKILLGYCYVATHLITAHRQPFATVIGVVSTKVKVLE